MESRLWLLSEVHTYNSVYDMDSDSLESLKAESAFFYIQRKIPAMIELETSIEVSNLKQ
jgi:hypothetical protein